MRLQDSNHTKIVLVTLPETTPVSEAAALQDDLRRARIEPYAWVVNRTLIGSGARDPLLSARMAREHTQIDRIQGGLAERVFGLPWQPESTGGSRGPFKIDGVSVGAAVVSGTGTAAALISTPGLNQPPPIPSMM